MKVRSPPPQSCRERKATVGHTMWSVAVIERLHRQSIRRTEGTFAVFSSPSRPIAQWQRATCLRAALTKASEAERCT